jgi:hypothetical protein
VAVQASPQELHEREVTALRRELESVQYRIDNLELLMAPDEMALGQAYAAKRRKEWQDYAAAIRQQLKTLGADVPAGTKRAKK